MRKVSCLLLLAGLALLARQHQGSGADDFKLEPGFTLLFNGKDLTGWKLKKGGESLDGKTEAAGKRFHVEGGKLIIDPKVKGDVTIETAKELRDVHIKFDFLPGAGCNNDLYFRGLKFDIKKSDVKNMKEGEWNEFEIIVQAGKAEFKCNQEMLKTDKTKSDASALGIRAEFGPIEYRNLRFK
jgi:hypothetical protein